MLCSLVRRLSICGGNVSFELEEYSISLERMRATGVVRGILSATKMLDGALKRKV